MADIGGDSSTQHRSDDDGAAPDTSTLPASRPRRVVLAMVAVGIACVVVAVALASRTIFPTGTRLLALVAAAGALVLASRVTARRWTIAPALVLVLWGLWLLPSLRDAVMLVAAGAALGAALGVAWAAVARRPIVRIRVGGATPRGDRRRGPGLAFGLACILLVVATVWTGASSPLVTWFGPLVSHGPRSGNEVAITFDDGPDGQYTLETAAILDRYGARGTFFMVGKAVAREPGVVRKLIADGQLVGNHSYHHDAWRWLDPRYPELDRTNAVLRRVAGVCPSFFRPPHGEHTPFMAHVVGNRGMTMVTWDVSAGDWATTNAKLVARRVLRKVRPGSIVLLHDGLDGNPDQNRSVVVRALPRILEGLRARGLHPVTLAKLLDRPGYRPGCGPTSQAARRASSVG